jgi:hypothetical protein
LGFEGLAERGRSRHGGGGGIPKQLKPRENRTREKRRDLNENEGKNQRG